MFIFNQFDNAKQAHYKVELHVHLDGSVRLTTIWELAQKKKIDLNCKTLEELFRKCRIAKPSTLAQFLEAFKIVAPVINCDLDAIERIAYEFCEDLSNQGVLYAEVRYSPHLFCISRSSGSTSEKTTPQSVVESVNKGLKRGQKEFDIKVRSILCCIRGRPEWSREVLDLCKEFRNSGVVGIDVAGDEAQVMAAPEDILVFKEAASLGIHRTTHAGEAGPASNVALAINEMKAERIGHGYHVVEDEEIYQQCLDSKIHFETCPYSSFLTGSVPLTTAKHPIIRFAEDEANFSASRDDPFIIQKTLEQEYDLLSQLGLRHVHFTRMNFNAARSCFLPESEKKELISKLQKLYGITDSNV